MEMELNTGETEGGKEQEQSFSTKKRYLDIGIDNSTQNLTAKTLYLRTCWGKTEEKRKLHRRMRNRNEENENHRKNGKKTYDDVWNMKSAGGGGENQL